MTSTESMLLRAVLESPGDDTPRLAYADEIEATQPERAEFIRVQLALAKEEDESASLVLHAREQQLWDANKCEWFGDNWAVLYLDSDGEDACGQYPSEAIVGRGFVAEVRAPLAALVGGECQACVDGIMFGSKCPTCSGSGSVPGIGRELFLRHPVTRVEVTDRAPWQIVSGLSGWGWSKHPGDVIFPGEAWVIPAEILDKLPEREDSPVRVSRHRRWFPTEAAARDALSHALVAHFREQCGLTPLA